MGSSGSKSKGSKERRDEQTSTKREDASQKGTKQKDTTDEKYDDTGSQEQVEEEDLEDRVWVDDEAETSGYPPPKPAEKDLTFDDGYFDDVDVKARSVPDSALDSFESLQQSLFDSAYDDAQKIRAILTWYCSLNIDDKEFPPKIDDTTPRFFLATIQDGDLTIEEFFTLFCRKIGVPCVLCPGQVKAVNYEVGDTDTITEDVWTAVYVDNDWRLVHPGWATSSVVGFNKGGKVLVDDSAATAPVREEAAEGANVTELDDYYIFPPADQFVIDCLPEKKEWQLLRTPFSLEDFIQVPMYQPSFFTRGFSFKRKTLGVQKSEKGMCKIAITPPDIKTTAMRSNLFFHERKSNRSWEEALGDGQKITPDKFVFKNRDLVKGEIEFEVRFAAIGIYQFDLFCELPDGEDEEDGELCSFRLDCDSIMEDCKPYPQVPSIGYGPGPETFQAGLEPRSHLTGRVVVQVRQLVRINFGKVVKDAHRAKRYKSELKSDTETIVQSHTWVSASADKKNYNIEVIPQKCGEYILAVSAKDTNQAEEQYENICNYLIEAIEVKGSKSEVKEVEDSAIKVKKVKESETEVKESERKVKEVKKSKIEVKEPDREVKEVKESKTDVNESEIKIKWSEIEAKDSKREVKESKREVKVLQREVKESQREGKEAKESRRGVKESQREIKESQREAKEVKESKIEVKESKIEFKEVTKSEENRKVNKKAEDNLRRALITKDVRRTEKALKAFEDSKMKDEEGLAEQARQRIKYLRLEKGLEDAIECQNRKQLKIAISKAERSDCKDDLELSLRNAKDELEKLKNDGENRDSRRNKNVPYPTPHLDSRTLLEIKRYINANRPVRDTMKAFLMILGEKNQSLTDWRDIKMPLHEKGAYGVVKRAYLLDVRQVSEEALIDSKKLLSKYDTLFIREHSVCVAAFYDWTKEVITITEETRNTNTDNTNKPTTKIY